MKSLISTLGNLGNFTTIPAWFSSLSHLLLNLSHFYPLPKGRELPHVVCPLSYWMYNHIKIEFFYPILSF